MVTLAERISDPEPRRSRRLPSRLRVPAVPDATAGKSVHGDCFTAPYPQVSTGIPACETNYPGAAAQPQLPASAKFCKVDQTRGFGLSPNALNINGTNTYQFVMSNPVGAVDPWGRRAEVSRPISAHWDGRVAASPAVSGGAAAGISAKLGLSILGDSVCSSV